MSEDVAYFRNDALHIYVLCIAYGYCFGILWAIFAVQGEVEAIGSPLVLFVISMVVIPASTLAYPILYLSIRERQLFTASAIILGVTCSGIVILSLIEVGFGFYGSFVAYVFSIWLARCYSPKLVKPGYCLKCAYPLQFLDQLEYCPECGHRIPRLGACEKIGHRDDDRIASQLNEKPANLLDRELNDRMNKN
ncbi:MAG: hypothetical protein ACF8OB_01200 [Phycisphaeraceae bacterium JB051]